jgi:hypothetical protein
MKTTWIKGLVKERSEEIRREFESAVLFRKRLNEILAEKIDSKRAKQTSEGLYESPSWAFQQADLNGYERALKEIQSLLEN